MLHACCMCDAARCVCVDSCCRCTQRLWCHVHATWMCVPPRAQIKLGSRCLQIDNSRPGTKPTVSECTGGDNQLFGFFQDFGHSFVHSFYIRPKLSKMCLEVEDGASDDGANIQQWECHGGANQRFIPGRLGWSPGGAHRCVDRGPGCTAAVTGRGRSVQCCLGWALTSLPTRCSACLLCASAPPSADPHAAPLAAPAEAPPAPVPSSRAWIKTAVTGFESCFDNGGGRSVVIGSTHGNFIWQASHLGIPL